MAAHFSVRSVVTRSGRNPVRNQEATKAMHPAAMYAIAQSKIADEHTAADRRRLARIAAESRPPRTGDQSIIGRVWNLITGVSPSEPALTGTAQ